MIRLLIFLTFSAGVANAAKSPLPTSPSDYMKIVESLQLPRKNRLISLSKNPKAIEQLHTLAVDEKLPLRVRWRAITTMGEMSPKASLPYLELLLQKKEWFLRNAAMIGISHAERPVVIKWAKHLLEDPSLIVRTSAVQAIKKVKGIELQDLLWDKINSKENFHKGKSLWIRKYMADTLASFTESGEEDKFMKLLLDNDKRLHPFAIRGLSKNSGKILAKEKNLEQKRLAWIQYYKTKVE